MEICHGVIYDVFFIATSCKKNNIISVFRGDATIPVVYVPQQILVGQQAYLASGVVPNSNGELVTRSHVNIFFNSHFNLLYADLTNFTVVLFSEQISDVLRHYFQTPSQSKNGPAAHAEVVNTVPLSLDAIYDKRSF